MMQQEHKQADSSIRGPKDDFKRQSSELRKSRGVVGADTLDDQAFTHPQLSADPQPGRSVPLEPTVQAPRKIEHTSMADMSFSSIPDSQPIASSTNTSSSIPASGPSMMEKVGEQTGASIEAAKAKLEPLMQPIVAKATSLYDQWKEDHPADDSAAPAVPMKERAAAAGADIKDRATVAASQAQTMYNDKIAPALSDAAAKAGPMLSNAAEQAKPLIAKASAQAQVAAAQARPVIENAIEQAKPMLANAVAQAQTIYAEQVQPALASGMSAAQEQIGVMREDGLQKTMDKANAGMQRRVNAAKTTITETYEAKVPLEQRQKIAQAQKGAAVKLRYGYNRALDIWETQAQPILREQSAKAMTFIRERKLQAPLAIAGTVLLLLLGWSLLHAMSASRASHEQVVVYQPDWRPSTGPVLGVESPSTMDKARATLSGLDGKLADGIESIKTSATDNIEHIKARTADLAQHAEDSISMGVDSIKVRAAELKDSMPSTADIKARMPSTEGLKANAESIKAQAEAKLNSAKASIPSTSEIKSRVDSTIESAKAAMPPTTEAAAPSSMSNIKLKINDRIEHVKAMMPEHITSLRTRLGNVFDRLSPAQRHYAHAHPELLNPEEHVVEFIDENGNAKSILDVDLQSTTEAAAPSTTSNIRLKINDRIEHVKAMMPEHITSLRTRLGNLYDRLTPAQRHYAHAHPEILNPEEHVIEFIDENGNPKSILDVDMQ